MHSRVMICLLAVILPQNASPLRNVGIFIIDIPFQWIMDDIFPDAVQLPCEVISIGLMECNCWGDAFTGHDFPIWNNFRVECIALTDAEPYAQQPKGSEARRASG